MTDTMLALFAGEDAALVASAIAPASVSAQARASAATRVSGQEHASASAYRSRIVADSTDRVAWLRARSRGITATDVAKLSTPRSVHTAAQQKLHGSGFSGNVFTDHGKAREPAIASWVHSNYGIQPSTALFRSVHDARHLATPDGVVLRNATTLELAEIKTTNKPWRSIPRHYLRQVWWQQYVLGAERTLLVWEQHDNFVPVAEPECRWVDRDDNEIAILVGLADQLLALLAAGRC
ncbi:YqaJ viral recombinase family protein [Rathayibacter soli]|uniref:YqaJ viral recombinase family protein n=1 Tax=Rathayibacter soli TaxID=3144168 RepID=UPI0027E5968D|nr:YqaJ viral recombinase family protein [Glaciibacter superstes]